MRRLRYQVACSLDGYIAGPNGEIDWIVEEPAIDFDALFAQFDTLVMGRTTYEEVRAMGFGFQDKRVVVLSRTLRPEDHPGVEIVASEVEARVRALKEEVSEKDVWLFGGGQVFGRLLDAGLVDTVEPAIIPVLLGGGTPFLPSPAARTALALRSHRVFPSGIVWLEYDVRRDAA
jgi:dihydrofolate reductase